MNGDNVALIDWTQAVKACFKQGKELVAHEPNVPWQGLAQINNNARHFESASVAKSARAMEIGEN